MHTAKTHTTKQCTLDKMTDRLYWCDREGGRIQRCSLDGSQLETLYDSAKGKSRPLTDNQNWCVGITIDTKRHYFIGRKKDQAKVE